VSGFSFKSNLFLGFLLNKSLISSFYISNILDLIKNSLSGKPSIYKNMLRNDRGIIPSKTALGSPSIVKVLLQNPKPRDSNEAHPRTFTFDSV
jgi:hypothetical protein